MALMHEVYRWGWAACPVYPHTLACNDSEKKVKWAQQLWAFATTALPKTDAPMASKGLPQSTVQPAPASSLPLLLLFRLLLKTAPLFALRHRPPPSVLLHSFLAGCPPGKVGCLQ